MSSLRGLPEFEDLWQRRTNIAVASEEVDLLSLEDLVSAKTTSRTLRAEVRHGSHFGYEN